jgi:hypothetical protein
VSASSTTFFTFVSTVMILPVRISLTLERVLVLEGFVVPVAEASIFLIYECLIWVRKKRYNGLDI